MCCTCDFYRVWCHPMLLCRGNYRPGRPARCSDRCLCVMLWGWCRHQLPGEVPSFQGCQLVARVHADGGLRPGHGDEAQALAGPLRVRVPGHWRGSRASQELLPAALQMVQGAGCALSCTSIYLQLHSGLIVTSHNGCHSV